MKRRLDIAFAILLIGTGAFYLAAALTPAIHSLAYGSSTWPFQVIVLGLLFFVAGILTFIPAFFIPGSIITGLGGVLYYQSISGDWNSWSYTWTLIPAFVGIGLILFGVFSRKFMAVKAGFWNVFASLIFFSIFGSIFGHLQIVETYWPVALIIVGVFVLLKGFKNRKVD